MTETHSNVCGRALKVLQVVRSAGSGGVESHVATLMQHLIAGGHHATLVSLARDRPTARMQVPGSNVVLLCDKMSWGWATIRAFVQLIGVLRRSECDIVHLHGARPIFVGSIAAFLARKQEVVSSLHGASNLMLVDSTGRGSRLRDWLARVTHGIGFLLSERVLVCAGTLREDAIKCLKSASFGRVSEKHIARVRLVYQGIDLAPFVSSVPNTLAQVWGGANAPVVIGTLSRLDEPKKGIAFLLDAVATLQRRGYGVRLRIAGDGFSRIALENQARDLGIQNCQFLGFVDNAVAFYKTLDMFALASLSEGMPLVLLEAMAAGLPVVTTDVGGAGEAVVNGRTGFVVPPRDAVALADALQRLIDDPGLANDFARLGKDRVSKEFTSEIMCRKIVSVYDELIQSPEIVC